MDCDINEVPDYTNRRLGCAFEFVGPEVIGPGCFVLGEVISRFVQFVEGNVFAYRIVFVDFPRFSVGAEEWCELVDECFSSKVMAILSFALDEHFFHHRLRRNTGMIGT